MKCEFTMLSNQVLWLTSSNLCSYIPLQKLHARELLYPGYIKTIRISVKNRGSTRMPIL